MKPQLTKYPRTPHVPWSKGTDDDKTLSDDSNFHDKHVTGSIKMDGENFTGYRNYSHARSLDSGNHPTRNKAKDVWFQRAHFISDEMRVCCENLFAKHNIHYKHLDSYLYVISIWIDNLCIDVPETIRMCKDLDLVTTPVFYYGIYDKDKIIEAYQKYKHESLDETEGFVIRLSDSFFYKDFEKSVAKFVEPKFRQALKNSDAHWMYKKIEKNLLKND